MTIAYFPSLINTLGFNKDIYYITDTVTGMQFNTNI